MACERAVGGVIQVEVAALPRAALCEAGCVVRNAFELAARTALEACAVAGGGDRSVLSAHADNSAYARREDVENRMDFPFAISRCDHNRGRTQSKSEWNA